MKKVVLMLAVGGLMLATPSCKKGENDPGLSLSSRKARVAGDWTLTGYESNSKNLESNGDYQTSKGSLAGDVITYTNTSVSGGTSTSSTYTTTVNEASFTFDKTGTYSRVWNTTTVSTTSMDLFGTTYTTKTTTVKTSTETGDWSFVGKVKDDYKNKERMIMNTLTSNSTSESTSVSSNSSNSTVTTTPGAKNANSYSYYSGENSAIFEIDQLKGKEMILKMISSNSGSNSTTPNGGSTTTTADDVYTSDVTVTLTAK